MKKNEVQHQHTSQPTAVQQNKGVALEAPQGESLAQLEAAVESSPQVAKSAQLAAAADASPTVAAQRRMADLIRNSPAMTAQRKWVESVGNSPSSTAQAKFASEVANAPRLTAQRQQLNSLAAPTPQHASEEPSSGETAQRAEAPAKPNHTGLPDNLKSGIESLSGLSMDNVKVHYNSSQPAQLNALAYAQGTDIHVAPGQEKHLPHEAWHVVQQTQGRVKPTMQAKGTAINDDAGLEHEADVMGGRAISVGVVQGKSMESDPIDTSGYSPTESHRGVFAPVLQGYFYFKDEKEPVTAFEYDVLLGIDEHTAETIQRWMESGKNEGVFNNWEDVIAKAKSNNSRTDQNSTLSMGGSSSSLSSSLAPSSSKTPMVSAPIDAASSGSSASSISSSSSKKTLLEPDLIDIAKPKKTDSVEEKKKSVDVNGNRKTALKEGVFTGTYECGPKQNWADLHITGETGGRADKDSLLKYFTKVYELMSKHHEATGIRGVLEWHPTGAVVTKQIVELLGESLGGFWEKWQAWWKQSRRRSADKESKREYNKMALKISPEFVPEHMLYLKSLMGAKGLSIRGVLPIPDQIQELLRGEKCKNMTQDQINELMSPNMISGSAAGDAALASYEEILNNEKEAVGPSLRITLDYRELPKLIDKLK